MRIVTASRESVWMEIKRISVDFECRELWVFVKIGFFPHPRKWGVLSALFRKLYPVFLKIA